MAFITGTTGDDFLDGTQEGDVVTALSGNDNVRGLGGADDINGNVGNDIVNGNAGNDTLHGGSGNDSIYGGLDQDILWGDRGTDLLYGGYGNDVFVLDNRDTAGFVLAEADCIADFSNGARREGAGAGFGRDILGLTGGITFDDLYILDGTEDLEGDTIVQDKITGKYLGIIKGIDRTKFSGEDFTTSIIPIFPSNANLSSGGNPVPVPSPSPTFTPSPNGSGGDGDGGGGGGGGGNPGLPNPCIPEAIADIPTPVVPPAAGFITVTTTQELIDAATNAVPGDSIFVAPGIYDAPAINFELIINTPNLTFFTNNANISPVTGTRSAETILRFGFDLNGLGGSADSTNILGFTFDDGVVGGGTFDLLGFSPIVVDQVGVDTDGLVIQNNRFLNVENNAIFINSAAGSPADGVTITGNLIDGTGKANTSSIVIFNASEVDIFNNDIFDYERAISLDSIVGSTDVKLNHITDANLYGIQAAGPMENLEISANRITNANPGDLVNRGAIVFFSTFQGRGVNEVCGNTIDGNGFNGVYIRNGALMNNTMIDSNNFQPTVVAGNFGIVNDSPNGGNPIVAPNNFFGIGLTQVGGTDAALVNVIPVSPLPYVVAPSF
jgi:hypothetical protein